MLAAVALPPFFCTVLVGGQQIMMHHERNGRWYLTQRTDLCFCIYGGYVGTTRQMARSLQKKSVGQVTVFQFINSHCDPSLYKRAIVLKCLRQVTGPW
jgi:hypothetical protein